MEQPPDGGDSLQLLSGMGRMSLQRKNVDGSGFLPPLDEKGCLQLNKEEGEIPHSVITREKRKVGRDNASAGPGRVLNDTAVRFAEEEHTKILLELQKEVERLKGVNRELRFNLVFAPPPAPPPQASTKPRSSPLISSQPGKEGLLVADQERLLQEEIEDLRSALQVQRQVCSQLKQHVEQLTMALHQTQYGSPESHSHPPMPVGAAGAAPGYPMEALPTLHQDIDSSLPLDVAVCQQMIRQLRQDNQRKEHELVQLKADLNDIFYSNQWTPDAFLIAKGCAMNARQEAAAPSADGRTPRLHQAPNMRHASSLPSLSSQRRPIVPYAFPRMFPGDVQLPALRPRAPNPAGRHRNVQAVQRSRHPRHGL